MKKTILKIEASILIAIIICCVFNINSFSQQCDSIRGKMLRMHVIANSDSEEDQSLKLEVRDAVLSAGKEIFDGSITSKEAIEKISPHIDMLEQTALKVIKDNGFDYNVKITLQKEYFNTRAYDDLTFPAGQYTALKVVLGEGKGKNWWCVMFPPLCVPAADGIEANKNTTDYLSENGEKIINSGDKYIVKFKLLELYEELRNKLKN